MIGGLDSAKESIGTLPTRLLNIEIDELRLIDSILNSSPARVHADVCCHRYACTYSHTPAQNLECEGLGHVRRHIEAQTSLLGVMMFASKECS